MRKLLVSESITLDGVFESPDKSKNDTFDHAGWSEPYADEEQMKYVSERMSGGDTLLLGRITYHRLESGWAHQTGPVADFMNSVKKYVVSKTMKKAEWNNSTLLTGDIAEEIAKLKKLPGKGIAVIGSGKLVKTLMENDLVDEFALLIFPIVLGTGKRFFTGETMAPLKLKETKTFSSGVVFMSYEPEKKAQKQLDALPQTVHSV